MQVRGAHPVTTHCDVATLEYRRSGYADHSLASGMRGGGDTTPSHMGGVTRSRHLGRCIRRHSAPLLACAVLAVLAMAVSEQPAFAQLHAGAGYHWTSYEAPDVRPDVRALQADPGSAWGIGADGPMTAPGPSSQKYGVAAMSPGAPDVFDGLPYLHQVVPADGTGDADVSSVPAYGTTILGAWDVEASRHADGHGLPSVRSPLAGGADYVRGNAGFGNVSQTAYVPVPFTGAVSPPVNGTQPPINGTAPPVNGTQPPINGTAPPVNGTQPPINGTAPPVNGTQPPINGTAPPVNGTQPPINGTAPPVNGTQPPINGTAPPVNGTQPPINGTAPPVNGTQPPINGTAPPVNGTQPPINGTAPPVNGTQPPINGTAPPVNGTQPPINGTAPPVNGTQPPINGTAPPVNGTQPPINGTAPPVNGTQPPINGTAPPVNGTQPPINGTAPPVNGTQPPINGTAPPVNGTQPPINGTAPPVNGTQPPINGTAPPVNGTQPPINGTAPPPVASIQFSNVTYNTVTGELRLHTDYADILFPPTERKNVTLTNNTHSVTLPVGNPNCPNPPDACVGNDAVAVVGEPARAWFAHSLGLHVNAPAGILEAAGNVTGLTAALNHSAVTVLNPAFLAVTYHADNGTLALQFSEAIKTANGSLVSLTGGAHTAKILDNPTVSNNTASFVLPATDRDKLADMPHLTLRVGEGAVINMAGYSNAEYVARDISISDVTAPVFLAAAYYTGNGTVSVQFSEAIKIMNGSKMRLTDGAHTVQISGRASAHDDTITETLNDINRAKFADSRTMSFAILRGAAADDVGNQINASLGNPVTVHDTTKPVILAAAYHAGNGTVYVQFSESIRTVNGSLMEIVGGASTVSLDTATVNGSIAAATLGFADRTVVSDATYLSLTAPPGAAYDMHDNHLDAVRNIPVDMVWSAAEADLVAAASGANAASFGVDDFVTTWSVTDTDKTIVIHVGGHTGTYTVNWGDGKSDTKSGNANHTYASAGSYTVSISGDFERFMTGPGFANARQLVALVQWGNASWSSMQDSFRYASDMVYTATDAPDLSRVTDMSSMFYAASSFNGDLSAWNVSSVTDMSSMFSRASSFNGNVSAWDVSSVTDMSSMFSYASSFNGSLSAWDVSSVTDMSSMFYAASSFNGDISTWDVSSVTDMSYMLGMFLTSSSFNGDISTWDVSSVTDMSSMFYRVSSFNGSLSAWDVSSVTDMSSMFYDSSFNGSLSAWDVSSVTDMSSMFYDSSFNGNISAWDVSSVTDMSSMFYDSSFNGNISAWDVSSVTDMSSMFSRASSFNGNISAWDVSSVTDMSSMFSRASSFNGNISAWDVSSVTDMSSMFSISSFSGSLSAWDVSSVTDMSYMFSVSSFNGNVSAWDVSSVTSMRSMFFSVSSFNGDISAWDVSSVTDMNYMFRGASSFSGNLSAWDVSSVTHTNQMFYGASSFNSDISAWDVSSATDMGGMFYAASSFRQNLGPWYAVLDNNALSVNNLVVGNIAAQNSYLQGRSTLTYSLVSGTGDADNSLFKLTGKTLSIKQTPDKSGYSVRIGVDGGLFGQNNAVVLQIAVNDVTKPTFTSATFTTDTGVLNITFSEPLDSSKHVASKFHVRNLTQSSGGITLSNGTITSNGTTFLTITLNSTAKASVNSTPTPRLYIDAGAVSDTAGNAIAAATNQTIAIRDTVPPEFSAAAYYTGNGTLTITFSEPLNGTVHKAKLHVRAQNSNTGGVTPGSGDTVSASGSTVAISFGGTSQSAITNLGASIELDVDADAIFDSAGNGILQDHAGNDISVRDTLRPAFSSAIYYTGNGTLAITFSEPLNGTVHKAKLHVRAQNSNTGGVTPGSGDTVSASGSTVAISFGGTSQSAITNLGASIELDVDADAIFDSAGNGILQDHAGNDISVRDTLRPTFSSAAYKTGNGALTVSFSEPLDSSKHVASKFHIRNLTQSSGGITLSNGTITSNGTTSLTLTLNSTAKASVNSTPTPRLYIDAGAVSDTAGNAIAAATNQTIAIRDTVPPEFSAAAYYTGNGTLTITFSEPLNGTVHKAKLHVRAQNSNTGGVTPGSGDTISASGSTVAISFGGTSQSAITNLGASIELDVDADAIFDSAGNGILQDHAGNDISVRDTLRPAFSSAIYYTGNGTLAITFSEPLNGTVHKAKLHVRAQNSNTGGVTPGSGDTVSASGSTVAISFGGTSQSAITNLGASIELDVDADAIFDSAGNGILQDHAGNDISVRDTLRPTFSSAAYKTGNGALTVSFSEPLDSSKHVASKFHIRNLTQSSGGITLSNGTITSNGTTSLTLTLNSTAKASVNSTPTPRLYIDAGAVSDTAGNAIAAATNQTIAIRDTVPPEFSAAAYYTGNGTLTITFSEPLNGTVHKAKLHVRAQNSNTGGVTPGSGDTVSASGSTVAISFGGTSQSAITNLGASIELDVDADAIFDSAGNGILQDHAGNDISVRDTLRPAFSSAIYYTGNGTLAITFSEPLNGTVHKAKLHVRAQNSNTGGVTPGSGDTVSASGSTVAISFGSAARTSISNLGASIELDVDADAIFDSAGNGILQDHAGNDISVRDTLRPAFSSAIYYTGNGTLAITFSEPLNGTVHKAKLHVRAQNSNTGGVTRVRRHRRPGPATPYPRPALQAIDIQRALQGQAARPRPKLQHRRRYPRVRRHRIRVRLYGYDILRRHVPERHNEPGRLHRAGR